MSSNATGSWSVALVVALGACHEPRTIPSPPPNPDAIAAAVDAGTPAALTIPAKARVAFDEAADFVVVQGDESALVGDLRAAPTWRNGTGTYELWHGYQVFDLPMDVNQTYELLRLRPGAYVEVSQRLASARFLEDLKAGTRQRLDDRDSIADETVVSVAGERTVVRTFTGQEHSYPLILLPDSERDTVLSSNGSHGGATFVVFADPRRTDTLEVAAPLQTRVEWLGPARSRALLIVSDAPTSLRVVEFPSGKLVAETTVKGELIGHATSDDGALVAWAAVKNQRKACGAWVLHVATGRVQPLGPITCSREEGTSPVAIVSVAADAVLVGSARTTRFDPSTGRALPPRANPDAGPPLDRAAFREELAALRRREPDLFMGSPLRVDDALLAARHGYEVLAWSNSKMVLVRRGKQLSLCTAVRGEDCRVVGDFDADEPQVVFSLDGSKGVIVGPKRVLVIDGRNGAVLASLDAGS